MSEMVGKEIGKYQLLGQIAEGDATFVYRAKLRGSERPVVVKILKPDFAEDQSAVNRFRQQAALMAQLEHPNILHVLEVDQVEALHYSAARFIEGPTLAGRMGQYRSPQAAAALLRPIVDALGYLHARGLVHGNLKPANILLEERHGPVLTGLAGAESVSSRIERADPYLAPEAEAGSEIDYRSDIYQLGVLLGELVAGTAPSAAPGSAETMGSVPESVRRVILKATSADPGQRYETPGLMIATLEAAMLTLKPDAAASQPAASQPVAEQLEAGAIGQTFEEFSEEAFRREQEAEETAPDMQPGSAMSPEMPRWRKFLPLAVALIATVSLIAVVVVALSLVEREPAGMTAQPTDSNTAAATEEAVIESAPGNASEEPLASETPGEAAAAVTAAPSRAASDESVVTSATTAATEEAAAVETAEGAPETAAEQTASPAETVVSQAGYPAGVRAAPVPSGYPGLESAAAVEQEVEREAAYPVQSEESGPGSICGLPGMPLLVFVVGFLLVRRKRST